MPPIDTPSLLQRCMGDHDFVREMLGLFRQQMTQHLETLAARVAAADVEGIRKVTHAMKGSSANLSATTLSAQCAAAEQQAKAGMIPAATAVNAIRAEFDRVVAYFPTVEASL